MMVVMPPAAAAWLADANVSRWLAPGSPDERAHVDQPGGDDPAGAIDDVSAFRHTGGADAAPGVSDHAIGDEDVAGAVEIPGGIDDAGVGEQDRAAVCQHDLRIRQVAGQRFEHRHPHRHSHFHLFTDQRLRAVRHN